MFDENDTVITEINDTIGIDRRATAIYAPPTFPLGALIELAIATGHAIWRDDDGSYRIEHCSFLAKQTT